MWHGIVCTRHAHHIIITVIRPCCQLNLDILMKFLHTFTTKALNIVYATAERRESARIASDSNINSQQPVAGAGKLPVQI